MTARKALYICYAPIEEPLVHTQVLPYLAAIRQAGVEVTLMTFEHRRLSRTEIRCFEELPGLSGIEWVRRRYHQRPSLAATLWDIAIGGATAVWLCVTRDIDLVHARSHVPSAMALLVKRLAGRRFIFDMRGLLADEYADAGHWQRSSLKFKLTKRMERAFFKSSDAIVMLTERIKRELVESEPELSNRGCDITVIPCCVQADKFESDQVQLNLYKERRGWRNRIVLTYAGKLGGWYLTAEMVRFFKAARECDPRFFLQVLTQSDPAELRNLAESYGIAAEDYDIRYASPEEVPMILGASDCAVSFIKPCYSKLASSPTKMGEYLAAGLPVVCNAGIGDCDSIFSDPRLGVLIRSQDDGEYKRATARLLEAIADPEGARCRRRFAETELSVTATAGPRYSELYEGLLPARERSAAAFEPNADASR